MLKKNKLVGSLKLITLDKIKWINFPYAGSYKSLFSTISSIAVWPLSNSSIWPNQTGRSIGSGPGVQSTQLMNIRFAENDLPSLSKSLSETTRSLPDIEGYKF